MVHYWRGLLAVMQREKRLQSLDEVELPGRERDSAAEQVAPGHEMVMQVWQFRTAGAAETA